MRYRNIVLDKTTVLEAKLKNLETIVQRQQPVSDFMKTINEAKDIVNEIADFVEREERSAGEINTGVRR
ncbi:MAG: hypothetical protein HKN40_05835 [Winogradskyella sp.]|uniref:hypothetical protein n=1 Tax=Winogradskyella sp. TaxID=1883156 RepID=UPI0017A15C0B|nr:hypothetical protein [Winogradskyella sp.]